MNEARMREVLREELLVFMPQTAPILYVPEEAAKLLKVTVGTLAVWRSTGEGPRYMKAGGIKYELRDINEFLREKVRD